MDMSMQDFVAMRELENDGKKGYGATTALWVIVAAIIVFAIAAIWSRNCNEKVLFATGLAQLQGKISCIEPKVHTLGDQNYGTAQTLAGTVAALNVSDKYINYNLNELNERAFFQNRGNCCEKSCCGGGNRRFDRRQTFTPGAEEVIVSETCQS